MDGTYNNPFAQGQSPLTPDTPSGGTYQVNINRKKTRKWVEAKVQSYDGDDWGADEFDDDDDDEPPPPVPRVTTGLRPVGQRLPSETNRPSPRLAAAVASSSRSSSGPPSLHLQTGQSSATAAAEQSAPPVPPHVQDSPRNTPSPIAGRNASPFALPSQQPPSGPSHQIDARSSTPHSTTSSTPARSSPLVRPVELRRLDEDRKSTTSPQPILDAVLTKPGERSTVLAGEATHQVTNAPTAFVAGDKEAATVEPHSDIDRTRMSTSPKLPDVTRTSIFGSDFFSAPSQEELKEPVKEPVKERAPERSDDVGKPELATKSIPAPDSIASAVQAPQPNSQPDVSQNNVSIDSKSQVPILSPVVDPRSVPPLRTSSPNGPAPPSDFHEAALRQAPGASPHKLSSDITPTEPLQPRRPDHSPSDYEPQSHRDPTLSAVTSSSVKESDMLSDEIMRSLSPVGVTPSPGLTGTSTTLAPGNTSDARTSSYTLSDYDNYWSDATGKPSSEEKKEDTPVAANPQIPTKDPQVTLPPIDALSSPPAVTPSSEDNEPSLRRRFSWEASFEQNVKVLKSETPVGGSSTADIPSTVALPSPGQSDNQPPKDPVPEITSTRAEAPKIVMPQDSNPDPVPPAQPLPPMLEPPSPVSTRTDESAIHGGETRRPSLVDDKMLAETPSHLSSDTPPPDNDQASSTVLITKPGQMPQVMGIKEIMALPYPSKRIMQYEESRKAFASTDLGLENWIIALKNQHPEYANATASFGGASFQVISSGTNLASSSTSNAPAPQPYYQQYLNASSPTTSGPSTSRSRLGGLPLSTQAATSAFGNSSNQIGTKSKEFMHSAGKMGKGLFSKGRSKLRGTGDKVFH